ncbi:hypothetical protein BDZ94DRAFT_1164885 [Collybia nuda]|uniref:Uncharacterized protein n=1 Tax=Collybia nuda TaxID=64659 RepID=A0A9P5Y7S4_9AGAR|nr:hypothetical protein BDZ94DRAFT_1164885 [Collybia nuda]
MKTGYQLCMLCITTPRDCNPTKPDELWNLFKNSICDDLEYILHQKGLENITQDQIWDYGLYLTNRSGDSKHH